MAAKSDYSINATLNALLRNTTLTGITPYVALFTSDPGQTGAAGELSGNGYARQSATFSAPSGGSTSNSADLTFPVATGSNWGTVTHFGIFDALTSGNMVYHGALTTSKTINVGDQFKVLATKLVVSES